MNASICPHHDLEQVKYICVHPACLKRVDNKLCCAQCNSSNHNNQLNGHTYISISELEKIANANYKSLNAHLFKEIEKNEELCTSIEKKLQDFLASLRKWENNQKKLFIDITENSNQVLAQNIQKADNLMKNPSLDTFIYFYMFNLQEKQNEMQEIRDLSTRQLEYQLNQIVMKRDILINQINFVQREHFLKFAQMDYQIEVDNLNNFQFEQCEIHLSQKEVLCTHPTCLQNNPLQLQCQQCISQDHKEHQSEGCVKSIAIIMKKQQQKKELIEKLQKRFKDDIKKSIDINLQKINEAQQNYYQDYEKYKEKAVYLEQQQLNYFLNPEIPKFIFGNLDSNLLRTTKEQIHLYYQQLYRDFEINFSNIFPIIQTNAEQQNAQIKKTELYLKKEIEGLLTSNKLNSIDQFQYTYKLKQCFQAQFYNFYLITGIIISIAIYMTK